MATGGGKLNNLPESAVEGTCGMGEVEFLSACAFEGSTRAGWVTPRTMHAEVEQAQVTA